MRRRGFITVIGGAAATWPLTAHAQEPRKVIGVLGSAASGAFPGAEAGFIQGLKDTGFIEGKNVSIEWRWAEGRYDRLSSLAGELVARNVSVISAFDVPSAFAAKAATKTIPIVFAIGADPIKLGLVDSLSQPGGNLTGVSTLLSALGPKQLELLYEMPLCQHNRVACERRQSERSGRRTRDKGSGRRSRATPGGADSEYRRRSPGGFCNHG